jgi:RHS repeat-associated protein
VGFVRACCYSSIAVSILAGFGFVAPERRTHAETLLEFERRFREAQEHAIGKPANITAVDSPVIAALGAPTPEPDEAGTGSETDPDPSPTATLDPPLAGGAAGVGDTPSPTPTAISIDTPTFTVAADTPTAEPTVTPTEPATPAPLLPTATPSADASLLSAQPDTQGSVARGMIDARGGRVTSTDGRITIDFPENAAREPLRVEITRRDRREMSPPSPDTPLVALWQLDAVAPGRGDAAVHSFAGDLTITLRFSPDDLLGRDPETLRYWSFDEATKEWVSSPGSVNVVSNMLVAKANHFSLNGATASPIVDTAPLLQGSNVGLQSGSASLGIPLEAPAGRSGMAPSLKLSYDSMRVEEQRSYTSLSGWTGMGWELGTGSIQFAYEPNSPPRVFLEGQGFGGEIMPDGTVGQLLAQQGAETSRIAELSGAAWSQIGASVPEADSAYKQLEAYGPNLFRIKGQDYFCCEYVGQLQRSIDGGVSWHDVGPAPVPSGSSTAGTLATSESADGTLYSLYGAFNAFDGTVPVRVYKSLDGGATWLLIHEVTSAVSQYGLMPDVRAVATHPTDASRLAFRIARPLQNDLIFTSTDGGASFTSVVADSLSWGANLNPQLTYILPTSTGRLLTFRDRDLVYSDDAGATWLNAKELDGATKVVTAPGSWGILVDAYAGSGGLAFVIARTTSGYVDVWRTANNGSTWERLYLSQSSDYLDAYAADYDPASDTLYISTIRLDPPSQILKISNASTVAAPTAPSDATFNIDEIFIGSGGYVAEQGLAVLEGYQWRLRDEQYIRIRSACPDGHCPFTVTDKGGTQYFYGIDDAHRRWYLEPDGAGGWRRRYYRLDLAYVIDTLGNRIDYDYWQEKAILPACGTGPQCEYVLAAYPQDIFYNYNGLQPNAQVHFNIHQAPPNGSWDNDNGALGRTPAVKMRKDVPYDVPSCGYVSPKVLETRRLKSVEMKVRVGGSWQLARRYDLGYDATDFTYASCNLFSGENTLTSLSMKGADGTSSLFTQTFLYQAKDHAYWEDSTLKWGYSWKHLTQVNNGFGGSVTFDYGPAALKLVCGCNTWSHRAVQTETQIPGGGQPNVVTTYEYEGPYQWNFAGPYATVADEFNSETRGYATATVIDAAGNRTIHRYHVPLSDSDWDNEIKHGREYSTRVEDNSAQPWLETQTNWSIRNVGGYVAANGRFHVNFIPATSTSTTLRDGNVLTSNNTYDAGEACPPGPTTPCYGLLTQVDDLGVSATGDDVRTKTAYHKNTQAWIFAPIYSETLDPVSGGLLGCAKYYYDGANTTVTQPTRGLLTATSSAADGTIAQCEGSTPFTSSSNTYTMYQTYGGGAGTYGNVEKASVATSVAPETLPAGDQFGWIPSSTAYGFTQYDTIYNMYPTLQKTCDGVGSCDELGVTTTIDENTGYNYLFGKPTKVTGSNGSESNVYYDTFGRPQFAWDGLDAPYCSAPPASCTAPTMKFTYTWGSVPNQTKVDQRTDHGVANAVHTTISCMDGFGRTVQTREHYSGGLMNSTRTDYDARGLAALTTNPFHLNGSTCPASPTGVAPYDRSVLTYDPLGNVVQTQFIDAMGGGAGAQSRADFNGLTSTSCDENLNTTKSVRSVTADFVIETVYEPASAATFCFDPAMTWKTTDYVFDRLGRLVEVKDAAGTTDSTRNRTFIGYDMLGRKTSLQDPDMGAWSYVYDAMGNLTLQTDARSIGTTLTYDPVGRITGKTYSNYEPDVFYEYDTYPAGSPCGQPGTAIGQMVRMTDGAGEELSCYDVRGRLVKTRRTVTVNPSPATFDTSFAYFANGNPSQITYPDGDVVSYSQTLQGNATGMTSDVDGAGTTYAPQTLLTNAVPVPFGSLANVAIGNGATTTYAYDYRTRLKTIMTPGHQDFTLFYDDAGNVEQTVDHQQAETVTYTYDQLHRLTDASGFQGGLSAHYSYNAIGNLIDNDEGAKDLTLGYPAPGAARPHAVTSTTGTLNRTFGYDKNGSLRWSGDYAYDFDVENQLAGAIKSQQATAGSGLRCARYTASTGAVNSGDVLAVALFVGTSKTSNSPNASGNHYNAAYDLNVDGAVGSGDQLRVQQAQGTLCPTSVYRYEYDGNGAAVKRETYNRGAYNATPIETIVYLGGMFEKNTTTGEVKKYYSALGRTIAVRDVPAGGGPGTLSYLLTDHLGSTVGMLDDAGASVSSARYWPYGGTRLGGVTQTDRRYTSQREEPLDPALGLYHYNARFYSTALGRFASVDPIGGSSGDPQAWNAYAYVRNNPLGFVDPSGMFKVGGVSVSLDPRDAPVVGGYIEEGAEWVGDRAEDVTDAVSSVVGSAGGGFGGMGRAFKRLDAHLDSVLTMQNLHTALDAAGMAPGPIGPLADSVNAAIYLAEGDYQNAALSAFGAVPVVGDAFKGTRLAAKVGTGMAFAGRLENIGDARHLVPWVMGDPARGILYADGYAKHLTSGVGGPASLMPRGARGFDIVTNSHVEGHAAALMHQGSVRSAVLLINKDPCPSCAKNLERMLPPGSELTVANPFSSYLRTFIGLK